MSYFANLRSSLVRCCTDFIAANPGYALTYFNFDEAADAGAYPEGDVLGLAAFELDVEGGLFTGRGMIGISTVADAGLAKTTELTDRWFDALLPDRTIDLFDASLETRIGLMKLMDGTSVMPIARAGSRMAQFIAFQVATDRNRSVP